MLLQKTMFPVRTAPAQRVEDAEGAVERNFYAGKCRTRLETNRLPPFQGGSMSWIDPGVKTPG